MRESGYYWVKSDEASDWIIMYYDPYDKRFGDTPWSSDAMPEGCFRDWEIHEERILTPNEK